MIPDSARKLCLLYALFACAFACLANASGLAQDQLLVLNNGQILDGKITLIDGRYSVEATNGSRMVIAEDRVNFVAESIKDVYWDKWSRVDPSNGNEHLRLFRWCLKYDLLDEAQKQIDLVTRIENMPDQTDHLSRMAAELESAVTRLEKEARLARQKEIEALNIRSLPKLDDATQSSVASVPTIPSTPIDAEGQPLRPQPRGSKSGPKIEEIILVDFEEDVLPAQRRDKAAWVGNQQLDRETRNMPKGTVAFYKKHIEPKLIANCISCHDSRSVSMPMSKRSFGQTIPRRMSQQNLHFVMEHVDRADPFASSLLKMATTAHGGQSMASFKPNDPFAFELKKWTVAVSEDPAKWLATLAEESQVAPDAKLAKEPKASKASRKPVETKSEQADVDPYDPSAFNRK